MRVYIYIYYYLTTSCFNLCDERVETYLPRYVLFLACYICVLSFIGVTFFLCMWLGVILITFDLFRVRVNKNNWVTFTDELSVKNA